MTQKGRYKSPGVFHFALILLTMVMMAMMTVLMMSKMMILVMTTMTTAMTFMTMLTMMTMIITVMMMISLNNDHGGNDDYGDVPRWKQYGSSLMTPLLPRV